MASGCPIFSGLQCSLPASTITYEALPITPHSRAETLQPHPQQLQNVSGESLSTVDSEGLCLRVGYDKQLLWWQWQSATLYTLAGQNSSGTGATLIQKSNPLWSYSQRRRNSLWKGWRPLLPPATLGELVWDRAPEKDAKETRDAKSVNSAVTGCSNMDFK